MKRKVMAMILASAMVANVTGCGSNASNPTQTGETEVKAEGANEETVSNAGEETTENAKEPVTLRFMWWGGDERAAATLDTIDAFQAEYPWITVEAEYGSSDGYQEKLTTQLSSGTIADIFQMGTGWMPGYVEANPDYFVDFNEYADSIDLTTFEKNFLINNGQFDGHQLGLPTGIAGHALLYNTKLADEIGLDFSSDYSWDDLIEMGKKVQAYDNSMYLLVLGSAGLNTMIVRPYLEQLTGKPIIDDATKSLNVTTEGMTQVMQFIEELYANNVVSPIADVITYGQDLYQAPDWINQKYVATLTYSSLITPYEAACPDSSFAAGRLPMLQGAKNDGWYSNCPQYMCINKNSEHVDEAVMFLNYFYNNDKAAELLTTVRSVPPTSVGQEVCAKLGILDGATKESVDIIQTYAGTSDVGITTEEEVTTLLEDAVTQIAYAQDDAENVATETIELLNNYLESK